MDHRRDALMTLKAARTCPACPNPDLSDVSDLSDHDLIQRANEEWAKYKRGELK